MVGQHWTAEDYLLVILPMWYHDVSCNVTKTIPPFLNQSNSIESLLEASLRWLGLLLPLICATLGSSAFDGSWQKFIFASIPQYLQNSEVTTSWRPPNLEFRANIFRIWALSLVAFIHFILDAKICLSSKGFLSDTRVLASRLRQT